MTVLLVAALLAVVIALWSAFDNPELAGTSYGGAFQCLAPWDTVLNGASDSPGGELPPDADEIAARCRASGERSFAIAVGAGGFAAALGLACVTLAVTRRKSSTSD